MSTKDQILKRRRIGVKLFSSFNNCIVMQVPRSVDSIILEIENNRKKLNNSKSKSCKNMENEYIVLQLVVLMQESMAAHKEHLKACYQRAIASIKKYPLKIENGQQATELKGIGPFMGNKIQQMIVAHDKNGTSRAAVSNTAALRGFVADGVASSEIENTRVENTTGRVEDTSGRVEKKSGRSAANRSNGGGTFAASKCSKADICDVLVGLMKKNADTVCDGITELELYGSIKKNRNSNIKLNKMRATLVELQAQRELILIDAEKMVYLTRKGLSLAKSEMTTSSSSKRTANDTSDARIVEKGKAGKNSCAGLGLPNVAKTVQSQNTSQRGNCMPLREEHRVEVAFAPLLKKQKIVQNAMKPEDIACSTDLWKVVLIIDSREQLSRRDNQLMQSKLLQHGLACETRALSLGDMLWIAQRYRTVNGVMEKTEYVLDAIVERKTVDDLVSSIMDKRFVEQKYRLTRTGLQNVIYLIEGSSYAGPDRRKSWIISAMAMTQVEHQFLVQNCATVDETVAFLKQVHSVLVDAIPLHLRYNAHIEQSVDDDRPFNPRAFLPENCLTFTQFNATYGKKQPQTVSVMFQKMLTRIPGVSVPRAIAISHKYPTFSSLYLKYQSIHDSYGKQHLLKDIVSGARKIGPACSKTIYTIFNAED